MLQVFYTDTELLKGAMAPLMLNISRFAALTTCCICLSQLQDVRILKRCKHFSTFLFFKEDEGEMANSVSMDYVFGNVSAVERHL